MGGRSWELSVKAVSVWVEPRSGASPLFLPGLVSLCGMAQFTALERAVVGQEQRVGRQTGRAASFGSFALFCGSEAPANMTCVDLTPELALAGHPGSSDSFDPLMHGLDAWEGRFSRLGSTYSG